MSKQIRFKIKRQADPSSNPYYEEFEIKWEPGLNVIAALMQIQKNPITHGGKLTAPVTWDSACLEEVCGACTMIINGKVRQACSTLVDKIAPNGETITLEPMTKFPVVRDLMVDRSRLFESMKRVKAWIQLDGAHDLGPGPRYSQEQWVDRYDLSRCFTCGTCLEVCPQVNSKTKFIGAAPISQARLMNLHPSGAMNKTERVEAIMGEGGVLDCGNAQNCVRACPKEIPLTTSLADMMRAATKHAFTAWLKR
ncbi:MAG: succinate dehydrogenase iron-sulfur subunit [Deltaproteobacteria bacterium]|nr:succinate dehydrogenase iron-sulfur subunit [Deltaproteobacteria bacterium]